MGLRIRTDKGGTRRASDGPFLRALTCVRVPARPVLVAPSANGTPRCTTWSSEPRSSTTGNRAYRRCAGLTAGPRRRARRGCRRCSRSPRTNPTIVIPKRSAASTASDDGALTALTIGDAGDRRLLHDLETRASADLQDRGRRAAPSPPAPAHRSPCRPRCADRRPRAGSPTRHRRRTGPRRAAPRSGRRRVAPARSASGSDTTIVDAAPRVPVATGAHRTWMSSNAAFPQIPHEDVAKKLRCRLEASNARVQRDRHDVEALVLVLDVVAVGHPRDVGATR